MTTYVATSVLWSKIWDTAPGTNETIAKDLLKSLITADVNAGKTQYTKDEVIAMIEYAYGRAGSTNPAAKANIVWSFARPENEAWFVEVTN
jgi:hypothetical protein